MNISRIFKDSRIQLVLVVLILGFFYFRTLNKNKKINTFKNKNSYTIGEIIDQNISGFNENFYVKFIYEVNGKRYTESVDNPYEFRDCYKTRECIGKKFVVYFNPDNPEEAYIDFDDER